MDIASNRVKKGYVMMFDVLGFKEFVSKRKDVDFFEIWSQIRKSLIEKKVELEEQSSLLDIDVLCLSDTLIVCMSFKNKTKLDPRLLLGLLPKLIDTFFHFRFMEGIFFRGAISFGEYRCDMLNNIAMGNAIDEAYEWHELTDWIGVILSPSAEFAYEKYKLDPSKIRMQ